MWQAAVGEVTLWVNLRGNQWSTLSLGRSTPLERVQRWCALQLHTAPQRLVLRSQGRRLDCARTVEGAHLPPFASIVVASTLLGGGPGNTLQVLAQIVASFGQPPFPRSLFRSLNLSLDILSTVEQSPGKHGEEDRGGGRRGHRAAGRGGGEGSGG